MNFISNGGTKTVMFNLKITKRTASGSLGRLRLLKGRLRRLITAAEKNHWWMPEDDGFEGQKTN